MGIFRPTHHNPIPGHSIKESQHFIQGSLGASTQIQFSFEPGGIFGNQQELVAVEKVFLSPGELEAQEFHDLPVIDGLIRHRGPILQGRNNGKRLLRRQVGKGLEPQGWQDIWGWTARLDWLFSLLRSLGFFRLFLSATHREEEEHQDQA